METTSSVGIRSSAGFRYRADISLYSAHTGTTKGGPLRYSMNSIMCFSFRSRGRQAATSAPAAVQSVFSSGGLMCVLSYCT